MHGLDLPSACSLHSLGLIRTGLIDLLYGSRDNLLFKSVYNFSSYLGGCGGRGRRSGGSCCAARGILGGSGCGRRASGGILSKSGSIPSAVPARSGRILGVLSAVCGILGAVCGILGAVCGILGGSGCAIGGRCGGLCRAQRRVGGSFRGLLCVVRLPRGRIERGQRLADHAFLLGVRFLGVGDRAGDYPDGGPVRTATAGLVLGPDKGVDVAPAGQDFHRHADAVSATDAGNAGPAELVVGKVHLISLRQLDAGEKDLLAVGPLLQGFGPPPTSATRTRSPALSVWPFTTRLKGVDVAGCPLISRVVPEALTAPTVARKRLWLCGGLRRIPKSSSNVGYHPFQRVPHGPAHAKVHLPGSIQAQRRDLAIMQRHHVAHAVAGEQGRLHGDRLAA